VAVVAPAAARARDAGLPRPGITDDDFGMFVRMIELAETDEQRGKALEVILGSVLPDSTRSPSVPTRADTTASGSDARCEGVHQKVEQPARLLARSEVSSGLDHAGDA